MDLVKANTTPIVHVPIHKVQNKWLSKPEEQLRNVCRKCQRISGLHLKSIFTALTRELITLILSAETYSCMPVKWKICLDMNKEVMKRNLRNLIISGYFFMEC